MDKYAPLASLFGSTGSTGSSDLDRLFGLRPVSEEDRAARIAERQARIDALLSEEQGVEPSQGRIPELSGDAKKRAEQLRPIFQEASQQTGVPVDLLMGLGHAESSFNPNARSNRDAKGVMQLIDSTAARYGVKDAWDPVQNIHGGAKYMRDLLDMFGGDRNLAVAAYNAGEGNVKKYGGIPPFAETRGHVAKVNQLSSLYGGQGAPIQSPAGSPADQLLPPDQQAQPQVDPNKFDLVTLTDGSQAYFEKGMDHEEMLGKLQANNVSAVPTRPFTTPSGQNVLVQYDMSDDEALAKIGTQTPELMQRPRGLPEENKSGDLAAIKKGLYEAVSPISTGLGGEAQRLGEYLGPESTIGKYATEAGKAMREYGAKTAKQAEEAFQMPKDASWFEKNIEYPFMEGAGQLIPYGAAYAIPGVGLGLGTVAGTTALYGGAMGEAEQKAKEVGKEFVPEEARPWALGDVALNTLGLRMLGPLKNVFGPEAVEAPQAFVRSLIEKEGIDGAKAKMGTMVGDVLKGVGVTGGANIANEVAEDMLFRGYGGQDLFNEDAINSYLSTAKQVAPIGVGMGAVHGVAQRSAKVEALTREEEQKAAAEAEAAQISREQEMRLAEDMKGARVNYEKLGIGEPDALSFQERRQAFDDHVAEREAAQEERIAALPEDLQGLPIGEAELLQKARGEQEKFYAPLGLPERGKNIAVKRRALDQLDITDPTHATAIGQVLDEIEGSNIPHNIEGMKALRQQLGEVQSAQQISETGPIDGSGGPQPGLREEGGYQAISGEGVEQGGQRIETPEIQTQEAVTPPEVTPPEVTPPEVTTPEVTTPEVTTPEVTTPYENVNHAAYQITGTPAYEHLEPLSHDDALFELDVLKTAAEKGKLTPARFANSEIGQRLDTGHINEINRRIRTGDFSALDQLTTRIQEAIKQPTTPEITTPEITTPEVTTPLTRAEFGERLGVKDAIEGKDLDRQITHTPELASAVKAGDIKGTLNVLSQHPSPLIRHIAEHAGRIEDITLETNAQKIGGKHAAHWNFMGKELIVRPKWAGHAETIAHEFGHALVHHAIESPTPTQAPHVQKLLGLYNQVKNDPALKMTGYARKKEYGAKNIHEFISEGMSNPEFQYRLSQIKVGNTTAWGKFTQMVAKLLGIKDHNALTEFMTHADNLIQNVHRGEKTRGMYQYGTKYGVEVKEPGEVDSAYHAGDLGYGHDTTLGRMSGGRSTGHFGTGVYFVGDKSQIGSRSDRPVHEVDFSDYNLARPGDEADAQDLHNGLRDINRLVEHVKDGTLQPSDKVNDLLRSASFGLKYSVYPKKDGRHVTQDEIKDSIIKNVQERATVSDKVFATSAYEDTAATRVMKDLGYEGVDVRHIPRFDTGDYGSVIYKESLAPEVSEAPEVEPQVKDKIMERMAEVPEEGDPGINCDLFAHHITGTNFKKLPTVERGQEKVGDVYAFGKSHYAVNVGDGKVAEVEEWGSPPQVRDLKDVIREHDEPTHIYSVPEDAYIEKAPTVVGMEVKEDIEPPTPEEQKRLVEEAKQSGLTAVAQKGNLGASVGAMMTHMANKGIMLPFQTAVFDERAPIANALNNLGANVGRKLRADSIWGAYSQRFNTIQQAINEGYTMLGRDGTLEAIENSQLAPQKIFERVRSYGKKLGMSEGDAWKVVSEMLVRLRAGTIREQDAKIRQDAQNYMAAADELDAHSATRTTSEEKRKFREAANKLRRQAQEKIDSIGDDGRTYVSQEEVEAGRKLYMAYKDTLSKEVDNIHELLRKVPDKMLAAGMVDAKQAEALRNYPFYFPFYDRAKFDEEVLDPLKEETLQRYLGGMGRGLKSVAEIKRQESHGHTIYTADNLLRHLMYWDSAVAEHSARTATCEQLEMTGGATRLMGEPSDKNFVVKVKRDGRDTYYKIHDPNVYYAFQASAPATGPIINVLRKMARFQRGVAVFNPLFWYKQLIRDPKQVSRIGKVGIITPIEALGELANITAGRSEGYKRIVAKGVVGPVDIGSNPQERIRALVQGKGFSTKVYNKLNEIHEAVDAATRAIVYNRAMAKYKKWGISEDVADALAIKDAREVMNFSRRGKSQTLNMLRSVTPFLGSYVNSIDVLLKAMSPQAYGKMSKADAMEMRRAFLGVSSSMAVLSLGYSLLMSDDEKWVNNADRNGNILVRNPFSNKKEKPFIALPLEFELGWLQHTLPENMLLANLGAVAPTTEKTNLKESAAKALMPPMDFFSYARPLINYALQWEDRMAPGGQGKGYEALKQFQDDKATEFAKLLSDELQDQGIQMFSPNEIEKYMNDFFGGYWSVAQSVSTYMLAHKEAGAVAPAKTLTESLPWFGKAFSGEFRDVAVRDAFNVLNDIQKVQNTFSGIKSEKNLSKYNQFVASPEYIKAVQADKALNGLSEKMTSISTKMATVVADENIKDPQEKRRIIDELSGQREEIAKEILKKAKAAGVFE